MSGVVIIRISEDFDAATHGLVTAIDPTAQSITKTWDKTVVSRAGQA